MHLDDTKHGIETIEDEEADASFPASDPPSWSGMHIGTPCPADTGDDNGITTETPRAQRERSKGCDPDASDAS